MINQILSAILGAGLPPATTVAGCRLLLAATAEGQANLSWDDFLALCGCDTRQAALRHLTRLQKAGVIHYSTNEFVYVTFLEALRVQSGACTRQNDTSHAPIYTEDVSVISDSDGSVCESGACTRQNDTSHAPKRDPRSEREREREYILLDPNDKSLSLGAPLTEAQQRVYAALIDPEIKLQRKNADKAARFLPLSLTLRMVGNWWVQREKLSVGALFYRLMNPGGFAPGPLSTDFRASEYYRRHYPLDPATARRLAYSADPDPEAENLIEGLPPPVEVTP